MKARILLACSVFAAIAFRVLCASAVTVVTFDDLPEDGSGSFISSPYQGLNWNFVSCNNAILFTNIIPHEIHSVTNGLTGNYYGMVSDSNVAVITSGTQITSTGANFDFLSANLTAFWNNNLNIEVQGFNGTNLLFDTTVIASATNATLFAFNYVDVSGVLFTSSGGTPIFGNDYSNFVMDNFSFEFIPEPSTILLCGLGPILLCPAFKRKRAKE